MAYFQDDDNEDLLKMLGRVEEKGLNDDMKLFYQIQQENIGRKSKMVTDGIQSKILTICKIKARTYL